MERNRLRHLLEDLQITVSLAGSVRVSPHWRHHNHVTANNCLYYFGDGEGSLSIRGQAYRPQPGDLYILPAAASISYGTTAQAPFFLTFCHFHAYVGALPLFQVIDPPLYLRPRQPMLAEQLFRKLMDSWNSSAALAPLLSKAALLELLFMIWEQEPPKSEAPLVTGSRNRWEDILRTLDQHVGANVSMKDIARSLNYSPNYFFRMFKARFGMTPHQYMIKLKLERAKHLLLTTEWTTARIAAEIGMERSQFSRSFFSYTDMNPKRFRQWCDATGKSWQQTDREIH